MWLQQLLRAWQQLPMLSQLPNRFCSIKKASRRRCLPSLRSTRSRLWRLLPLKLMAVLRKAPRRSLKMTLSQNWNGSRMRRIKRRGKGNRIFLRLQLLKNKNRNSTLTFKNKPRPPKLKRAWSKQLRPLPNLKLLPLLKSAEHPDMSRLRMKSKTCPNMKLSNQSLNRLLLKMLTSLLPRVPRRKS